MPCGIITTVSLVTIQLQYKVIIYFFLVCVMRTFHIYSLGNFHPFYSLWSPSPLAKTTIMSSVSVSFLCSFGLVLESTLEHTLYYCVHFIALFGHCVFFTNWNLGATLQVQVITSCLTQQPRNCPPVFTIHSSSLFSTLQPNWYFQDIVNLHYLLLKILWIAFHFT